MASFQRVTQDLVGNGILGPFYFPDYEKVTQKQDVKTARVTQLF